MVSERAAHGEHVFLHGLRLNHSAGPHGFEQLIVCDQPALTSCHLDRLVQAHRAGATIVGSEYSGTVGVPALFHRTTYPALLALRGDEGARRLLRAHAPATVAWPEGAIDVDTPEDVSALAHWHAR